LFTSGRVYVWRTARVLAVKHAGVHVTVWTAISRVQYFVDPILTLRGRNTAREYVDRLGNQVHPMIQTLFLSNDAVFQNDNSPIHTTGTDHSWFEEHEGELRDLPWPAKSPHLSITEPLRSVLETTLRNRFHHL
jgi:hypothetical protein